MGGRGGFSGIMAERKDNEMRTVKSVSYDTNLDDLCFGYWYKENKEDEGGFVDLQNASEEDVKEAAEYLKCSPELVEALIMFAGDVQDNIRPDLIDIWKRLDSIEAKQS